MPPFLLIILTATSFCLGENTSESESDDSSGDNSLLLRFLTYNLRFATTTPNPNEEFWPIRAPLVLSQLHFETMGRPESLLCFQEALAEQVIDLHQGLAEDHWDYVGVGRDDGEWAGEFSPIFYRPSVWELQKNDTYWLSETPRVVGSIGWDAHLPRIVTVAKLQHRKRSSLNVVFACTHFASNGGKKGESTGEQARQNSARLLSTIADKWSENDKNLVVMAGDFNSQPGTVTYQTLSHNEYDVKSLVSPGHHHGNHFTYNGFGNPNHPLTLIDHIFVRDPEGLDFLSYSVPNNVYDDGIYSSDHCPVIVDIAVNDPGRMKYIPPSSSSSAPPRNEEKEAMLLRRAGRVSSSAVAASPTESHQQSTTT